MPFETNLAYDLSRFDRRPRQQKRAGSKAVTAREATPFPGNPQSAGYDDAKRRLTLRDKINKSRGMETAVVKNRMSRLLKLVICCVFIVGMLAVVISGQARVNELNRQIIRTDNEITQVQTEIAQKQLEIEKRVNIRTAEDIARNEYGMVPMNGSQIYFVELDANEDVEGIRMQGSGGKIKMFFDDLFAYISGQ